MPATTIAWKVSPTPTESAGHTMRPVCLPLNEIHVPDVRPRARHDHGLLPAADHDVSAEDLEPDPRRERRAVTIAHDDRVAPRGSDEWLVELVDIVARTGSAAPPDGGQSSVTAERAKEPHGGSS